MDGKITKFYKYEKTSGRINIPSSVADILDWDHNDKIKIIIRTIDGHQGLFIFKNEKKKKEVK